MANKQSNVCVMNNKKRVLIQVDNQEWPVSGVYYSGGYINSNNPTKRIAATTSTTSASLELDSSTPCKKAS